MLKVIPKIYDLSVGVAPRGERPAGRFFFRQSPGGLRRGLGLLGPGPSRARVPAAARVTFSRQSPARPRVDSRGPTRYALSECDGPGLFFFRDVRLRLLFGSVTIYELGLSRGGSCRLAGRVDVQLILP